MPPDIDQHRVSDAFARAESLEQQVQARWPYAFTELDRLRRNPPGRWPKWCLLPSAAAATVVGEPHAGRPAPVAAVSAVHAWRYARSVYLFEPELAHRLMRHGVAESSGLDTFTGLPQWCLYIAGGQPGWPGAGLWAHLDYQATRGTGAAAAAARPRRGRTRPAGPDPGLPRPAHVDRSAGRTPRQPAQRCRIRPWWRASRPHRRRSRRLRRAAAGSRGIPRPTRRRPGGRGRRPRETGPSQPPGGRTTGMAGWGQPADAGGRLPPAVSAGRSAAAR